MSQRCPLCAEHALPTVFILTRECLLIKRILLLLLLTSALSSLAVLFWARQPIMANNPATIDFVIAPGSGARSSTEQIASAGIAVNARLLELVARATGKSARMKAGSYTFKPGTSPLQLIEQLTRGEFAQETLIIVEGWTFAQMRAAIAAHPALRHESVGWTDADLMRKLAAEPAAAEGMFFPDTYLFARNASDLQIYRQAYGLMQKKLDDNWSQRDADLPYQSPYQALIMASIVEKETGHRAERGLVASVFVNRLRRGMMLQTDPTVIYGMGQSYTGQLRKRDLLADTPFNTYTRTGLPPTPIALPGEAALRAALHPIKSDALYFVARGDGTSQFSDNLRDHNRAVNRFQR